MDETEMRPYSMKAYYTSLYMTRSNTEPSLDTLSSEHREFLRRWHWRQYFLARRRLDRKAANYHNRLATELEEMRKNPKEAL